jgi:hypothetical protein
LYLQKSGKLQNHALEFKQVLAKLGKSVKPSTAIKVRLRLKEHFNEKPDFGLMRLTSK